ncbi:DUF4260 domain-containing protein [Pseudobacillus badius]|uniref:DUF4260 domain-containing protein n=1 Tax=Bacillus badius TaxID=1455 RepID=UPI0007B09A02|nr:hypothetical protein A4244_09025 [Bacillus badius]OCS83147.1 hypothetical protein A6M11_09035 [Bacillus badius]OVE51523.1 DUF4260 domain-containing protein [Bacillus badius]TDW02760.1 uncharacterized protein DUF4260 [Bacillus badius]GLY11645.1 hypothetical protein Bbad01_28610 [Bacillus badius]
MMIKPFIRLENGLGFAACLYVYVQLGFPLWLFFLLLLAPDITMIGYLLNTRTGALLYNWGHSFVLPLLLAAGYMYASNEYLLMISIIWAAHICVDRLLGYGLKYHDSFKITHLQRV